MKVVYMCYRGFKNNVGGGETYIFQKRGSFVAAMAENVGFLEGFLATHTRTALILEYLAPPPSPHPGVFLGCQ